MPIPEDDITEVSEEHQEELQRFISNLSEDDIDIENHLDDLISLIKESDTEILLEYLAIAEGSGNVVSAISEEDEVGLPPRLVEYLLGLISVYGGTGKQEPSFQKFGSLVQDLVESIIYSKIREMGTNPSEEEFFRNQVEFNALNRELSTGRFIFSRQYDIGARKAYRRYNSILKYKFGFTIEEALTCSKYIRNRNAERWGRLYSKSNLQPQDLILDSEDPVDRMTGQLESDDITQRSKSKKFLRDADYIDRFHDGIRDDLNALWLPEDDLYDNLPSSIDKEVFSSFIDRMALDVGKGDQYTIGSFRSPFDFNPIHKRPLLRIDDKMILPRQRTLMWSLVETFYYDLIEMDEGKFGDSFGDYLEEWTANEFSKVFRRENVFLEPYCGYNLNEEAADVLVTYEDTLFIIECKTGKLPLHTRKGEFNIIEDAMKEKVGEGYDQACTTINEIQSGLLSEVVVNGKHISLEGYSSYQPLIIVGEPYDLFATSLGYDILEVKSEIPYITDIYNLQVITEALDSPELLKRYILGRRQLLGSESRFVVPHEIDFLGLFMDYGNRFPEMPAEDHISIVDMTKEVCEKIDYKYGP